ncbi:WhiB family transcriptional regulator [Luteipulveratus mongoliensis]
MDGAACTTRPDLPWTDDAADVSPWDALSIRETCATCPVRLACAAHAYARGVTGGWWAGADRDPDAASVPEPTWDPPRKDAPAGVEQGCLPLDLTRRQSKSVKPGRKRGPRTKAAASTSAAGQDARPVEPERQFAVLPTTFGGDAA